MAKKRKTKPKNKVAKLTLAEVRNLAKQHNKVSTIKNISTSTRKNLIAQIEKMGYSINHEKKSIQKTRLGSVKQVILPPKIKVSKTEKKTKAPATMKDFYALMK